MKKPTVSVLMTIFNHQEYLKRSIKSIQIQTFNNWELIAIDNGSTDNSTKILKSIKESRIKKIFLKKNIGRTKCLNLGLKLSKGKFIAILDSDDIAMKGRLKEQIKYFTKFKKTWLLASNYKFIDEKNKISIKKNVYKKLKNNRKILFENHIAHSTVMFKRDLLKKIGIYPKEYTYAQDYAFYLKIYKKYKIDILNKYLVDIRINHKDSETFRSARSKLVLKEEFNLLIWRIRNFKYSIIEYTIFIFKILKNILKIFIYRIF